MDRAHSATVIALITVLALLAAPICAPLCAARSCSSSASHGQCHEMAGMAANPGDQYVAPSKTCATPDISAVLANTDEQHKGSALALAIHLPDAKPESFDAQTRSGAHRVPLESKPPSPLNAILRI